MYGLHEQPPAIDPRQLAKWIKEIPEHPEGIIRLQVINASVRVYCQESFADWDEELGGWVVHLGKAHGAITKSLRYACETMLASYRKKLCTLRDHLRDELEQNGEMLQRLSELGGSSWGAFDYTKLGEDEGLTLTVAGKWPEGEIDGLRARVRHHWPKNI